MNGPNSDKTIARTPNVDCPACWDERLHTPEERRAYHPDAGHGYTKELGWTKPGLKPEAA